ncbi:MAG: phosphotransferase, partial [Pseudomonadota bacterium]|nr:phosphotransferase [Pseudomonadota bacterium]
ERSLFAVGRLLRDLHVAGAGFNPPEGAVWRPWFGRELGENRRVFGHCDFSPWNIVARDGVPVALIDWETAGPVDALVELGQACWLSAQLHDSDVARRVNLPPAENRARHAALICEGYELPKSQASKLVQAMIDIAIADAANEAVEADVTPDTAGSLWGIAWRARASAWMMRHRGLLVTALS